MHREVGHSSMLHILRNIRDNMEFLELPGGGTHQPFSDARRGGRTQVDEAEDDLVSFRDPGHRAGPGGPRLRSPAYHTPTQLPTLDVAPWGVAENLNLAS